MPVDFTELLENVSAPPMRVDAEAVLTRGRRRRLHRRLYGTAAVLAAAALVMPVASALRADVPPPAVPAVSPPVNCVSAGQEPNSPIDSAAGIQMTGTPWLDSGPPTGTRTLRVQVNTDTCQGVAVAVTHGSASSISTSDVTGQPHSAFWVVEASGGGLDKLGKPLPVKTTAVALLPNGQRVCGIGAAPEVSRPEGQSPSLIEPITTAAGHEWQATFAAISGVGDPQRSAVLKICEGARVVEPSLRPLNGITEPTPTSAG